MNKIWNFKNWNNRTFKAAISALLAAVIVVSAFAYAQPAQAHCDSYQGPVVLAAQKALETANVKLVLVYVRPDDEAELTAAFNHAIQVRKLGGEAKKLADQFFFETTVRLHRQGEGAAYTGLEDEAVPASIQGAGKAMQTGKLDAVNQMLNQAVAQGLAEKYAAVAQARANAKKLGTVAALREQAEAELMFEKYVYALYTAATSTEVHSEGGGEAAGGHTH